MNNDEILINQFIDEFERIDKRFARINKQLSEGSTDAVARERRASARERRLLMEERQISESSNSAHAENFLALKSELEKAIAAADAELSRKEKSARTGGILLQSMVSDLQQELVSSREEISRLQLQKGELEMKIGDVSRDLDDYREKLKTALSDVKASVFDQARGGVFEQTKEEISKEVSRQIRLHMKGEKDDG